MVVDDHEVGNSTVASLELISECDMTVSYPGECQWRCNGGGINNIFDGNLMQAVQDDAQAMVEVMNRNNITQEFGMPRDNNLLESHAGRVGGVPDRTVYRLYTMDWLTVHLSRAVPSTLGQ